MGTMGARRTKLIGAVAIGLIVYGSWIVQCASQPAVTTSQVYLEATWATEWPRERITIDLGRVEDLRFHDEVGRLNPEPDGTYRLTGANYYCYYHISVSPNRNKMSWVPSQPAPGAPAMTPGCRPATIFYRIRDAEEHRDRDCCGERHRDRDCCGERHRDRDCCGERHRDRDCCGERGRREPVVWRHPPPCHYCGWGWADPWGWTDP